MKFIDHIVKEQFLDPAITDERIVLIICYTADWVWGEYGIEWMITGVARTPGEAAELGSPNSSHIWIPGKRLCRAIDSRTHHFDKPQLSRIMRFMRHSWGPPEYLHLIYHDSGHGDHLHVNINYPFAVEKFEA